MTITFRCVLILVSLFTLGGIVKKVRNAKVQIENTIFWILFGVILLILSIFPQIATLAAKVLGIYSTTNFIFLFIIFIASFDLSHKIVFFAPRLADSKPTAPLPENKSKKTLSGISF